MSKKLRTELLLGLGTMGWFVGQIQVHASVQEATVTQLEGDVKIFTKPGKTMQCPPPRALFEGQIYSVTVAKLGDRVGQGNILRTAPGAKARVVYENGDQINVGPASAYRVSWSADTKSAQTDINLMYGKIRGIVEKGGPRSQLKVRTKSATMGVRGTDFFIADEGTAAGTEVTIMRGEVEVKSQASKAPAVPVKAGMSAEIPPPPPARVESPVKEGSIPKPQPPAPAIAVRAATQQELVAVQKTSEIKAAVQQTEVADQETQAKLQKLETKAVQTTLQDIRHEDPELYKKLSAAPVANTAALNSAAMESLVKVAPVGPEKRKPSRDELDDLGSKPYEKYFKKVE